MVACVKRDDILLRRLAEVKITRYMGVRKQRLDHVKRNTFFLCEYIVKMLRIIHVFYPRPQSQKNDLFPSSMDNVSMT